MCQGVRVNVGMSRCASECGHVKVCECVWLGESVRIIVCRCLFHQSGWMYVCTYVHTCACVLVCVLVCLTVPVVGTYGT